MSNIPHIPEKYSIWEKIKGFTYSMLIWIAWILLVSSVIILVLYFFSFIIKRDFFNENFIQLCIYIIIGSFSLIFIYDEKCQKKFGVCKMPKPNKLINKKEEE